MATIIGDDPGASTSTSKPSIVDDFMYGSNVAGSHMYIRLGFLRKVYGILSAQLIFTTVVCALILAVEPLKLFVQQSQWLVILAAIASFGLIFALMVKRKEFPTNFILLGIFTFCESILVGTVVTFYNVQSVIEAFVLTCAVTASLTLYTFQSKRDFSSWGASLFAVLWILILAGIMQLFIASPMMEKMLAVGGAILFSLFIVFDTHMIMHKVSPEEYIDATINLYLDIINLFLHLLRILGERNK